MPGWQKACKGWQGMQALGFCFGPALGQEGLGVLFCVSLYYECVSMLTYISTMFVLSVLPAGMSMFE